MVGVHLFVASVVVIQQLVVVSCEQFELFKGARPKAVNLLLKSEILWGRAGAEVVGGFGVEMVDDGGHGRILIF